ncbi:dihydroorotase, partial [Chloroflexota bacterium]
ADAGKFPVGYQQVANLIQSLAGVDYTAIPDKQRLHHCFLSESSFAAGLEERETIATGTMAAARGGFTTICCMPNTNPPLDNRETIDYVKSITASEGAVRVLPIGCVTKCREGEELANLEELKSAGVVGYSDDGSAVATSRLMRQALERSRTLDMPIIDHCEDLSLAEGGSINEGAISAKLGIRGIPAAAEDIIVARDLALAGLTGGWLHLAHLSTEGSMELVRRAKQKGIRVTAEVTVHHLTLTEEKVLEYGANAKINPPLRSQKDVGALIQGIKENMLDIIVTDHAPWSEADKQGDIAQALFGLSGFETALGALMGLVHQGHLPLSTVIARLTCEPAKIIGDRYGRLGTLAAGAPADVVIFDPDREWVVNTRDFASKGKNTPLAGATLKGKVIATIALGSLAYKDKSISLKEDGEWGV